MDEETYYKVKWIGSKKETWEPEENMIGCQDAIDNFLVEEKTRLRYVQCMKLSHTIFKVTPLRWHTIWRLFEFFKKNKGRTT